MAILFLGATDFFYRGCAREKRKAELSSMQRVVEFPAKLAGKASRLLGKPAGNFGAGSTLQQETSRNLSKLGALKQRPFCL